MPQAYNSSVDPKIMQCFVKHGFVQMGGSILHGGPCNSATIFLLGFHFTFVLTLDWENGFEDSLIGSLNGRANEYCCDFLGVKHCRKSTCAASIFQRRPNKVVDVTKEQLVEWLL